MHTSALWTLMWLTEYRSIPLNVKSRKLVSAFMADKRCCSSNHIADYLPIMFQKSSLNQRFSLFSGSPMPQSDSITAITNRLPQQKSHPHTSASGSESFSYVSSFLSLLMFSYAKISMGCINSCDKVTVFLRKVHYNLNKTFDILRMSLKRSIFVQRNGMI